MTWIDKVPSAPFTDDDIRYGAMNGVVDDVLDMAAGDPTFPRLPPARRLPVFGQLMPEFRVVSLRELMRSTGPLDSMYQATLLMMAAALVPGGPLLDRDLRPRDVGFDLRSPGTSELVLESNLFGPARDAVAIFSSFTNTPGGACSWDGIRRVALGFLKSLVDALEVTDPNSLGHRAVSALARCVRDSNGPVDYTMLAGVPTKRKRRTQ